MAKNNLKNSVKEKYHNFHKNISYILVSSGQ